MVRTDPNIFKRNMEALTARYPELAERVKYTKVVNYEIFQHGNCIANVKHTMINKPWYIGNISDYFEQQWKGLALNNIKYPIFLGMGLSYEAQYFLTRYGVEFKIQGCFIIERDIEMFLCAMNTVDLCPMLEKPNVHFIVGLSPSELYITMRNFFPNNLRDLLFCGTLYPIFSAPAMEVDKNYYLGCLTKLYEATWDCIMNYGNCPEDSLIGLENMLDNVGEIVTSPGITKLYDKFKGKPAIIVATGPSLKKNINQLKGLEDKALIVSVDASLKLLLENGINPHLVTSLEREHAVQQFFENIDADKCKDIYMTTCPVLFNHVYESYNGPKIMAYRNFDHFKWLGVDKGILDIKLSSSNMAFTIAKALGCDPIILVGQDLAYGENDETHATPVPFSSAGEHEFMIQGNCQEQVRTNDGWFAFLKGYEVDIDNYDGKVINATEGGAYIKGTEVDTLQNAIEKYIIETFNPLDIIKENLKSFDIEEIKKDISHVVPLLNETEKDLKEIIDLCTQGAKQEPTDDMQKMFAIRTDIQNRYHKTFQGFLMHVVQSYHLMTEFKFAIDEEKSLNWYMFIGDITQICLQSLLNAKSKIEKISGEINGRETT